MNLDRIIATHPAERDGDLMLCRPHGVAYQADRDHVVAYDAPYYDKCAGYDGTPIGDALNRGRVEFVARHFGPGRVADVGIGSGQFIRSRPNTYGYDVNPVAIEWLKRSDLWAQPLQHFGALTFWDVLEHCPDPGLYLDCVQLHGYLFASIPTFTDLARIRESKHYRPGEHLYYWTADGFALWMHAHGFLLLEVSDFETRAGRESITSFAFKRYAWPTSN